MAASNGSEAEPFGVGGTLHFETARAGKRKVPKVAYVLLVASVRSPAARVVQDLCTGAYQHWYDHMVRPFGRTM